MKTRVKFIVLFFISFSITFLPVRGMDNDDTFKIKFARQKVKVRTSDDDDVWSTWEDAIKNQGLAEHSARKVNAHVAGMCGSHAIVSALEYCHQRSDLLASYLHKAVTGGYDEGMDIEEGMRFVKKNGVMALPAGQTVIHGSGYQWPSGPRYKFKKVSNPYYLHAREMHGLDSAIDLNQDEWDEYILSSAISTPKNRSSEVFKYVLKKYNHPIVVSIHSGYKGREDLAPFGKYRGSIHTDVAEKTIIEFEDFSRASRFASMVRGYVLEKTYHAIVLYGYKESTQRFLVKNSWGPYGNKGLCTLPYEYFNCFTNNALVGFGDDLYEEGRICINEIDRGPPVEVHLNKIGRSSTPSKSQSTLPVIKTTNQEILGQFVFIPGGTYEIGNPLTEENRNPNSVWLNEDLPSFSIMDAAVTQELYAKIMGENPSHFNGADHPVEMVTWEDANKFAQLLSAQDEKYTYNLPTAAQLEVALRGGTKTAFVSGSDDEFGPEAYGCYCPYAESQTYPVKSKLPNALGIYRSNVNEWVHDRYAEGRAWNIGFRLVRELKQEKCLIQ